MTFSIVAVDLDADEVGVATQSKFIAVGAVVPWARGGVGAVATQSYANVLFGPNGLDLLEKGLEPREAIELLLEDDKDREKRQVGIVDAQGRSATYTGSECIAEAGGITGDGYACQGNILATERVVPAMAEVFEGTDGRPLAERLIESLRAAQREGGDKRGQEGAALYIAKPNAGYGGNHDRYIDLRVDHHDQPIEELARLLDLWRLYFEKAPEAELVTVDEALTEEIRQGLARLGKLDAGRDLWEAFEEYLGWENLEERWVGKERLDPRALEYFRRQVAAAG